MNLKLFFSHAWADKAGAKVKKLLLFLQKDYDVWLDKKQIDLGNHINDTVAKGIEQADIFIIVWSRNAFDSKGVLFELETAVRLNKTILVLLIENFDISHSTYLAGKEYLDFSGDAASFKQQEVYLQNFLLRKKLELFQQELVQPKNKAAAKKLANKTEGLQDVLIELEDTIKRKQINASGNDDSDVYIQSSLNAFEKTLDKKDEEGKIMLQFSTKMKEISEKYPLKADDKTKKQLAIKAIEDLDPNKSNTHLIALKAAFEKDLGAPKKETVQAVILSPQTIQNELQLVNAYKNSVDKTREIVLQKSKSAFDAIPALNFLSSLSTASAEYEMSYVTNSPAILEKMYEVATTSQNNELRTLIFILIQHITIDDLQKMEISKQIKSYMPYAYLINNTARLLVQAKALNSDEISYSIVSSLGLDKLTKFFFKEDWKEKAEKFLDLVKNNYGIKDKNLNWLKAAATVVGVVLVADGLTGLGDGDSGEGFVSSAGESKPVYFEDKMASMGFSMPNTVQY